MKEETFGEIELAREKIPSSDKKPPEAEEFKQTKGEIQEKIASGSQGLIKKGQEFLRNIFKGFKPEAVKEGEEMLAPIEEEINQLSTETLKKVNEVEIEDQSAPDLTSWEEEDQKLNERELKIAASIAYGKIRKYASQLGVDIADLPLENISFLEEESKFDGTYSSETDALKSKKKSVSTLIHEELHFATATDKRAGANLAGEKRFHKTGFHSAWNKENINKPNADLLRSLNEAVTEKMAQEIFLKNKEEIDHDIRDCWPVFMEKVDLAIKNQSREKIPKNFAEEKNELLENNFGYPDEIKVLNAILARMGRERAFKEGTDNLTMARSREIDEWKELQKAYLKGDTLYLKKIEKTIPGILREFNALDRRKVLAGEQTQEEFDSQVASLIEHALSYKS